jgi:ribosomal protein S20
MANTKSAKKALRASLRKKVFNQNSKSKITASIRELRKAVSTDASQAKTSLSKAFSALDKAVKTKFIKKGTANRKKSRLAKMVERELAQKQQ